MKSFIFSSIDFFFWGGGGGGGGEGGDELQMLQGSYRSVPDI